MHQQRSNLEDYYKRTGLGSFPPDEEAEEIKPKEKPVEGSVEYYQDLLNRGLIEPAKKWLAKKTPELSEDELLMRATELVEAMVKYSIPDPDIIDFIRRQPKKMEDDLNTIAVKALNKKNGLIF